jgi:hypothetical protein
LDRDLVVWNFLEQVEEFSQILFVSERMVRNLFGEEVVSSLSKLEQFSKEHKICADCGGRCCEEIGCEFFAKEFGGCPIREFRPLMCRFHFCHRFGEENKFLIIALRDIYLECFKRLYELDAPRAEVMNSPPFVDFCPDFAKEALKIITEARKKRNWEEARKILRDKVRKSDED